MFDKNIDSSNLTNRNSESMLLPDSSEQPTTSEINKTTLSSSQSEEEEEYLDDSIQKSNLSGFDTFGYPLDYSYFLLIIFKNQIETYDKN